MKPFPRRRNFRRSTIRRLSLQSLDDRRVLAAISGAVFDDLNDSMRRDAAEVGLANRIVYLDLNDNASLDRGEWYELTDSAGAYRFDNVADGAHVVRVFNGTSSQIQTTPTEAALTSPMMTVSDVVAAAASVTISNASGTTRLPAVVARGTTLETIGSTGSASATLDLGFEIASISRLRSGELLVVGHSEGVGRIVTVESPLSGITEITGGSLAVWDSLAVDDAGLGILRAGESIWSIDVASGTVAATDSSASMVLSDSSVRLTDAATRSVVGNTVAIDDGQGGTLDGLSIDVWSNASASPITAAPIVLSGATAMLAFSDVAGLLAVRQSDGIGVYDVDNNLSLLYTIADVGGPVSIDAARGVLLTLAAEDAGVRILDAETGSSIADLAIDLAALGGVSSIVADADFKAVLVVGGAGVAEISLRRPAAARVTITGGLDLANLDFGMRLLGANVAPQYGNSPVFQTLEDVSLNEPAPAVWADATDGSDTFVSIQRSDATFGIARVSVDGSLSYVPFADANGQDRVTIWLHDGRDFSEYDLPIYIIAVADAPTGIQPLPLPVPENVLPGAAIAPIIVLDPDLPGGMGAGGHAIEVSDARFQVINGQLVLVGTPLNYESEPEIYLTLSVRDADLESVSSYELYIQIGDEDDPITAILPTIASVTENDPGASVATLTFLDEDDDKSYTVTVDDDRFVVESGLLRLIDGASLDREREPTVTVNVTAISRDLTYTQPIVITVGDVVETPGTLALSNESVLELRVAGVVGEVIVDGNPGANGHTLSVDDSRFVIVGSTLRLANETFVTRADQEIIELNITATVTSGDGESISQTFLIDVLENLLPFHNSAKPHDVNGDNLVTALDALVIINYLNLYGPGPVGEGDPAFGYDVNGDGQVTALDALLVINELNRLTSSGTVNQSGEGEPESPPVVGPIEPSRSEHRSIESPTRDVAVTPVDSGSKKAVDSSRDIDAAIQQWVEFTAPGGGTSATDEALTLDLLSE